MSPLPLTLILLLAAAAMASTASEWAKYKMKYHKFYSEEEDAVRMKIWLKNLKMVEKHNSEQHSYTIGTNKFSDWTDKEFNRLLGYRPEPKRTTGKTFPNVKTPQVVDYRKERKVTPVQDQGHFGTCWAFSAIGAVEGLWAKNMGELINLSEQQLIDCMGKIHGNINAWKHIIEVGGSQSEESYPYTGLDGQCQEDASMFVAHVDGFKIIAVDESQIESALVEIGHPISIGVSVADTFKTYTGGVYDDPACEYLSPSHALLIVGYDKSGPEPFWIVKNSWGSDWGDNGYGYMKMGVDICNIMWNARYPTLNLTETLTLNLNLNL